MAERDRVPEVGETTFHQVAYPVSVSAELAHQLVHEREYLRNLPLRYGRREVDDASDA